MKTICIIIGTLFLSVMVYRENAIEINGTVIDSNEKIPLRESHVYVKGTHIGVVADEKGTFSLKVPLIYKNKSLIVSYVGYSNYDDER